MRSFILNFNKSKKQFEISEKGKTIEIKKLNKKMDNADLVLLELGINYSEQGTLLYNSSINHFPTEFKENFPKNKNSYVWAISGESDFILNESLLRKNKEGLFERECPKGFMIFKKNDIYFEFLDIKKS